MAVELSEEAPPKQKRSDASNNQEFKFSPRQYSFKDDQMVTIFHLLNKGNKLKLLTVWQPENWGIQMIPTIASSTERYTIPPAYALSLRIRSKY